MPISYGSYNVAQAGKQNILDGELVEYSMTCLLGFTLFNPKRAFHGQIYAVLLERTLKFYYSKTRDNTTFCCSVGFSMK